MRRRNTMNVKDTMRAKEEELDRQLKEVGIWEEGLHYDTKLQYLAFIKTSENTAKEEERQREISKEHILLNNPESPSKDTKNKHPSSPVKDDSDPIITYESPSNSNIRSYFNQSSIISNKALANCSTSKDAFENPKCKENASLQFKSISESSSSKGTCKEIYSLLSNRSITVQFAVQHEEKLNEDDIVSQSDDEIVESTNSLVSPDISQRKLSLKESKSNSKESKHISPNVGPSLHSNGKNSSENSQSLSPHTHSRLYSLNSSAVKKAICHPESHLHITRQPLQLLDIQETLLEIDNSQNISEPTSPEPVQVDNAPDKLSMSENSSIKSEIDFFVPNVKDDTPLARKIDLIGEKPNLAFMKLAYETESKCVKRIYSLITDWQIALAKYQSNFAKPIKWGLPICVDRQTKIGLLKKHYYNKVVKPTQQSNEASQTSTLSDTSDTSSESEKHISDCDEDWNIFALKRKKEPSRSKRVAPSKLKTNKEKLLKSSDLAVDTNEQLEVIDSEKEVADTQDAEVKETKGGAEGLSEKDSLAIHEEESHSQSLLDNFNDFTNSLKTKLTRKSFQLFPKISSNKVAAQKPSSLDVSKNLPSSSSVDKNDLELVDSSSSKPSTSCQGNTTITNLPPETRVEPFIRQNNIKRKLCSSPLNLPPPKKNAHVQDEIRMECEIKPSPVNLRKCIRRRKEKEVSPLKKTPVIDEETKKRMVEAILEADKMEEAKRIEPATPSSIKLTSDSEPTINVESSQNDDILVSKEESTPKPLATEDMVECPLCQTPYPLKEIEAHASECNEPPDG